jgi:DNA repair ATPase RecN
MTVLTGETGAGKSILLGALGAALGNRMPSKGLLKDPSKKAIVEVSFQVSENMRAPLNPRTLILSSLQFFVESFCLPVNLEVLSMILLQKAPI